MKDVAFRKMHGLGNDFMLIDARSRELALSREKIAALADRHTGVGFDQLLILENPADGSSDAAYRVFNADGTEVEQCGNGVRCIARYLGDSDCFTATELSLQGAAGKISAKLLNAGQVEVSMGEPDFDPAALPFAAEAAAERYQLTLDESGDNVEIGAVSMGNPHAVLLCSQALDQVPVNAMGAAISGHSRFPRQTNVEFMQLLDPRNIVVRVFERGVGETMACGTGACAAVAMGRHWGLLDEKVKVALPGGTLEISWRGPGSSLFMRGPAVDVFGGKIEI